MDHLGLVEAIDRFGEGVIVSSPTLPTEGSIPASASRSVYLIENPSLGAAIAVMNEAAAAGRPSVMERLLQGVEAEFGVRRPAGSPADDPSSVGVDDEGDIDEAGPCRDVGNTKGHNSTDRGGPSFASRLGDGFGRGHELHPCFAGGVDNGVVVVEDPVGEPVGSEILPDVLDRV